MVSMTSVEKGTQGTIITLTLSANLVKTSEKNVKRRNSRHVRMVTTSL